MRQHKKRSILLYLLFPLFLSAQTLPGHLLVVGGGSENYNNWSDTPYGWAVAHASNKKVAIIGTSTDVSNWLPDYFISLGAVKAKNFVISSSSVANQQATYDSLIGYDMVFFRGGNQYNYYNRYKNTLTQQAVEEIFNRGGVVGGTSAGLHILSKVVYTAQNGTVYPDEALNDPFNQYMTLADDFLSFLPGIVFDSHVAERARFGRMIGFLARWKADHNASITAIGMDDKTALCIDTNFVATVWGTGAANILKEGENNQFGMGNAGLSATNLQSQNLVHGQSIHLLTHQVTGFETIVPVLVEGNVPQGNLFLSGSDVFSKNTAMLDAFAATEAASTAVMMVSNNENSLTNQIKAYLENKGIEVSMLLHNSENGNNPQWVDAVNEHTKYLIVNASYAGFMSFLQGTAAGERLLQRIFEGGVVTAFVGGNSRFAGKSFLFNYEQQYAGYDGLFEFQPGLSLLRSAIVMPNTFSSSTDNENTITGLPYGMIRDSLKHGIWLHDNAYVSISKEGNDLNLNAFGGFPVMVATNTGMHAGFTDQSAVSTGNPRAIASFESFQLQLPDENSTITIDQATAIPFIAGKEEISFYPNPATDQLSFDLLPPQTLVQIIHLNGSIIKESAKNETSLSLDAIPKGVYVVRLISKEGSILSTQKLIIQ
jgi:cyanophycinase-like exopeptidase